MASDDIERVATIGDPADRARVATELLATHQDAVTRLAQIRRRAIAELRSSGLSYAQVADALGVSRGRIAQLRAGRHVVEHDFFGGPAVTIATPLRASNVDRPLVAQEDFEAAATLARVLNAAEIETTQAQVSTRGEIDFSPDALVAICGPKSSHMIAQAIATDPVFDFSPDAAGLWLIRDRGSGETFRSPAAEDPSADRDVAYVARLRRPGGERPFLVIAGVQAIGSLGAVTYLSDPTVLHALHRKTAGKLFSMVVRSRFTRSPLAVLDTEALTEARSHDD